MGDAGGNGHRAEVVELDRPLVVVEAVVGEGDRAPDRAPRVVDEVVDVAEATAHGREAEVADREIDTAVAWIEVPAHGYHSCVWGATSTGPLGTNTILWST